jgi:hypothetical protein
MICPMATTRDPSIKGSAFQSAPEDLRRLLASGRLDRERLEAALEADDLRILDEKIDPTAWYPIASYARMVELLADTEARGSRIEYLLERGRRAAERLSAAGTYQQLDASTAQLGARVGKVVVTIAQLMYNFSRWSYESVADGDFEILVEDARLFPEVGRYTSQGFIERASSRVADRPIAVESERKTPDRIVFRGRYTKP